MPAKKTPAKKGKTRDLPRFVEPEPTFSIPPVPKAKVEEPWEPEPPTKWPVQAVPEHVITPLEAEARLVQSEAQAVMNAMSEREPDRKAAFLLATRIVQSARKMQDMLR